MAEQQGTVPVPDPTKLTTDAVDRSEEKLRREIEAVQAVWGVRLDAMERALILARDQASAERANIRSSLETELNSKVRQVEIRLDGMDTATALLAENVNRVPTAVDLQVGAARAQLETRFDGMDRATRVLAENLKQVPTDTEKVAYNLREFILSQIQLVADTSNERFKGVASQFESNDKALIAALSAAKEAVSEQNKSNSLAIGKSENATQKQIDALQAIFDTSNKSLEDKIADLKGRLDRGEGQSTGTAAAKTEQRLGQGALVAIIAAIIAAVGLGVTIIIATRGH